MSGDLLAVHQNHVDFVVELQVGIVEDANHSLWIRNYVLPDFKVGEHLVIHDDHQDLGESVLFQFGVLNLPIVEVDFEGGFLIGLDVFETSESILMSFIHKVVNQLVLDSLDFVNGHLVVLSVDQDDFQGVVVLVLHHFNEATLLEVAHQKEVEYDVFVKGQKIG